MHPKVKVINIPYHLILLLLLGAACPAQSVKLEYLPKNADSLKAFLVSATSRKAKEFGPKYQKEIKNELEERKEHFVKTILDSSYIYNSSLNRYLKTVLTKIYEGNPDLPQKDFYFLIDRSPIPNAGCYGNGLFSVNLGLFSLLDSEGQLASVLCHEIAHYQLKHNDKSLIRHVETMNAKETKSKISKIKSKRYGRRQALDELQKELAYNFMKRSRSAEMQADSLGLALLKNAGFDAPSVVSVLKKLKDSDSLLFSANTNIRSRLNFEGYPFREGWLEPETRLFDTDEMVDDRSFNKDSLKSHPDIDKRLGEMLKFTSGSEPWASANPYLEIKKAAGFYMIQSAMDARRLDIALYQALTMAEDGSLDEKSYALIVAGLLKKTYELKQNHTFGKYVGPVSPFSEEVYLNEVRLFLNRLEIKNIRRIGHFFCEKYRDQMNDIPEFEQITAFFQALNPN